MCVKLQEYMVGFKYRHIVWRYKAAKNRLQLIIWPHKIAHLGRDYHLDWWCCQRPWEWPGQETSRYVSNMGGHSEPPRTGWKPTLGLKGLEPRCRNFFSTGPMFGLKFDASNVAVTICDMVLHMGLSENGLSHIPIYSNGLSSFPPLKKKTFLGIPYF